MNVCGKRPMEPSVRATLLRNYAWSNRSIQAASPRKPKGARRMKHEEVAEELNRRWFKTRLGREHTGQIVQNILRKWNLMIF
jgi:hypothetical protein